jgi:hypothetical protein
MNIGNLFAEVGYNVYRVREIHNRWPPKFTLVYKISGGPLFRLICQIYGLIRYNLSEIQIVATKG